MVFTLWLSSTATRGRRVPPGALAVQHDEMMVDAGEQAIVVPSAEVAIDRALRRQVLRQKAPWNAATQNKEDAVYDVPQRPQPRPPERVGGRQQRFEDRPFGVGQIG